ncbi:MAG: ATP-dependent helicase [Lachnospiraceae bacterium]|nr:ATP-dependent helicase [Lachnospiraceae bacterium]
MGVFHEQQARAIRHKDGPMLVLAGPGSGKTLVITYRTKYLIEEGHVDPSKILVVTFTNAAAREMRERFGRLTENRYGGVTFGTFHSVFFGILRWAYRFTGDNILREEEKKQILKEICEKMELEVEEEGDFYQSLIGEISLVKGSMIRTEYYYSTTCADEAFREIYTKYNDRLRKSEKIDFDDMLVLTHELFTARPDLLKKWQEKFQYILIDEFQDINKAQYEVVRLLAAPKNNLFIVGDDDQSIYRFRGAKPEIMLGFEKDYPQTQKVLLGINYRCSGQIVDKAGRIIENNKHRFPKEITSNREEGVPIKIENLPDGKIENEKILNYIKEYYSKGIPYSQMAVIYRTNTQPRLLIGKLMEYNIPFQVRDTIPSLFDHWIARNLKAYLKMVLGDRERQTFLSIMNRPKRYVSRNYVAKPTVNLVEIEEAAKDKPWVAERIHKLYEDLIRMKKLNPYDAIDYIRKNIGYDDFLTEYAQFRKMKAEELFEVLEEIQETAKEYKTIEDWFFYMEQYEEELKEQLKAGQKKASDSVVFTTMHSAKGLEYEVVFLIDANEGIIPHKKALKEADLEEERRLFYVAVTRAKNYLHIFVPKELYQKEMQPSRFVREMGLKAKDFPTGTKIVHKKYGPGEIVSADDKRLKIYFERLKGERQISLQFALENDLLRIIT